MVCYGVVTAVANGGQVFFKLLVSMKAAKWAIVFEWGDFREFSEKYSLVIVPFEWMTTIVPLYVIFALYLAASKIARVFNLLQFVLAM